MTTTATPPVRTRQPSRRTVAAIAGVVALAAAIVLTLWLLISPAPSHPSTFAPSAPHPASGSAQLCVPAPSVRFC